MIQINPIRSAIVKGLKAFTGATTILAEQNAPQPPYPFISVKMTLLGQKKGHASIVIEGDNSIYAQQVEKTLSVTCYHKATIDAENLVYKALQYFEVDGIQSLQDQNITIVRTSPITDRTTFLTTDYEYRMGFDVTIRTVAIVTTELQETIENTEIGGL